MQHATWPVCKSVITATSAIESLVSGTPRSGTNLSQYTCQIMVEYTRKLNRSFNRPVPILAWIKKTKSNKKYTMGGWPKLVHLQNSYGSHTIAQGIFIRFKRSILVTNNYGMRNAWCACAEHWIIDFDKKHLRTFNPIRPGL